MTAHPDLQFLNAAIEAGETSCAALVEAALARARDPQGEGSRVFRVLNAEDARRAAATGDRLRARGAASSPLAGLPVSLKDNIDVAGQITVAGSPLLEDAHPARCDATVVARLKAAGAAIVGRTSMSELAFSGIGINRFFGTPANPWDRATRRIPGGSSSGAAVSVADGMAAVAIGTDTGGSVRIPAALCGLCGFKPTQARVPRDGVLPLSSLLDCVGPLARNIADCALVDGILSGDGGALPDFAGPPRLCTADEYMLEGADETVRAAYANAKSVLLRAGAQISPLPAGSFDEIASYIRRGSFSGAEAWQRFGPLVLARPHAIDPRIAERITRGRSITAADLEANRRERATMVERFESAMAGFDALIAPTVPVVAPKIAEMEDDACFRRANALILRNPMVANLLDAPSLTLPCHSAGAAPVGLMLIGARLSDRRLLSFGLEIERLLAEG